MEVRVVENIEEARHDESNVTVRDEYENELGVMQPWMEYKVEKIKDTATENVGDHELRIRPVCKHIIHRED